MHYLHFASSHLGAVWFSDPRMTAKTPCTEAHTLKSSTARCQFLIFTFTFDQERDIIFNNEPHLNDTSVNDSLTLTITLIRI